MLLNAYYYAPHVHCMLREHLEADLAHIAELGADAVSICVQEGHMERWFFKRLERVIAVAHEQGLAVHAVPNRWGGLVAGWCEGYDGWSVANAHGLMPGYPAHRAFSEPTVDATRRHYEQHLTRLLESFAIDGLIWDEPCPGEDRVIAFLDEMTAYAKLIQPDLVTSLFLSSSDLHLTPALVRTRYIDFLGSDGHVRSEDHEMARMKTTFATAYDTHFPVLSGAGKKTMFLLEAQRHRDEDLDDYLKNLHNAFTRPMDHLMFYYSSHEMLDPGNERRFNEATWNMVRRLAGQRSVKSDTFHEVQKSSIADVAPCS